VDADLPSNAAAGGADIAAAKAIEANIVGDFARYGLPQRRVVDPLRVTVTRSESRPVLNELRDGDVLEFDGRSGGARRARARMATSSSLKSGTASKRPRISCAAAQSARESTRCIGPLARKAKHRGHGARLCGILNLAGPALVGEINGGLSCMLRAGCGRSLAERAVSSKGLIVSAPGS